VLNRLGGALFWAGLGLAFWPYALSAAVVAYEQANGDDYCRAWTGVNDLAMAPAAIAFIASALLNFSLRRTAVMLVVALGGPSLSLACGVGHG